MEKSWYLEVTVISGEALKVSGQSLSKNSYVVVRAGPSNSTSTDLDRDGGSTYPCWNQKVDLLPLSPAVRSFVVEVHYKTKTGDKMLGAAKVPLTDIVTDYLPATMIHFLSYRLRERNGERNGIINLAARLVEPSPPVDCPSINKTPPQMQMQMQMQMPMSMPMPMTNLSQRENMRGLLGEMSRGGVAIGTPVSFPGYSFCDY